MIRKQRKKKWVLAAGLVLTAALIPAEASSPSFPNQEPASSISKTCRQKAIEPPTETLDNAFGSCTAGSDNCCYGFPETACTGGGGGGRLSV